MIVGKIASSDALENLRKEALGRMKDEDIRVLVCAGTGCVASGSPAVYDEFKKELEGVEKVTLDFAEADAPAKMEGTARTALRHTGCQGICELGPLVRIQKGDQTIQYVKVHPEDVSRIVHETILGDEIIESLLYHQDREFTAPDKIPFIAKQTRIVLANCGRFEPDSLEEYLASGGFKGFTKALFEMTPAQVVDEVDRSGLRGRGGAGFPTGKKWSQVARQKELERYVVCNGDEGDPGAFMDGSVMEGDPYRMIEGMMIAAYAVGAQNGYIYVRAEYPLSVKRLSSAIQHLEEAGLLGDNILGTDFSFYMHINRGAGAFVCGEGSALTGSIEGKRGMPRVKPPRTVEKGLWEKPTVLNNVETYANVARIVTDGADWYRSIGTEKSPGTKTFSITGAIANTGLIEVPFGTTLREMIFDIGGGIKNGKKVQSRTDRRSVRRMSDGGAA